MNLRQILCNMDCVIMILSCLVLELVVRTIGLSLEINLHAFPIDIQHHHPQAMVQRSMLAALLHYGCLYIQFFIFTTILTYLILTNIWHQYVRVIIAFTEFGLFYNLLFHHHIGVCIIYTFEFFSS